QHGGKRSGGVIGASGEERDEEQGGKSEERKAGFFFFVNEGATDLAMAAKVLLHPLTHWVIDSGSSWHMTPRANLLDEIQPAPISTVTFATGAKANVMGMGCAKIMGADGELVGLKNVLWAAAAASMEESVIEEEQQGVQGDQLIGGSAAVKASTTSGQADWETWHRRLTHVAVSTLEVMHKEKCVHGLQLQGDGAHYGSCEACMQNKFARFPFPRAEGSAKAPLEVVHMDLQQQVQIGLRLQEIERSAVEEVQLHLEDLTGSELTSDHSGGGEQQVSGPAAEEGLEDESARVDSPSQPEPAATAKVTKRSAMAVQANEGEDEEMAFCFFTPLPGEPATVEDALSGPQKEEWKAAMDAEFNSLIENGTWELVELPEGRRPISSKWVFKVKSGADCALERFKSRLDAKGFQQKEKVDFKEIFAPVVKPMTLRTVLAGAAEDIYMAQPDGYEDGTGRVCKLKKAIYGLKQAPRCWYEKLEEVLLSGGFKTSQADHSLFILGEGEQLLLLLVNVDDILLFSPSMEQIERTQKLLMDNFKCKMLGDAHY
ncbi:unnamed protein product, partial [Closterium sp. NIES-54]